MIKRRAGDSTPTIADWTDNAAVKKADTSGKMSNTLAIDVGRDKVRFLVNGTEVSDRGRRRRSTPPASPGCASTTISTSTWKDSRSRADKLCRARL